VKLFLDTALVALLRRFQPTEAKCGCSDRRTGPV
jgi:hypothetical protein